MASHANSTTVPPPNTPALWQAHSLFIVADALREIVTSQRADDALQQVCDHLLDRLIELPLRQKRDVFVKLWLLNVAGEREWAHDHCARPVIGQLIAHARCGGLA